MHSRIRLGDVLSKAWRKDKNVIERAVILTTGTRLRLDLATTSENTHAIKDTPPAESEFVTDTEFREMEKLNLLAALRSAGWRVSGTDGAAVLLGLKPSTLAYRMKTLGIAKPT